MALLNLARQQTLTTGPGTITLGPVVTGFASWAAAGAVDGRTYTYGIEQGNQREIGRGVYTAATQELTRNVLKSTNNDQPIELDGTAQVVCTPAAEDFVTLGAVYDVSHPKYGAVLDGVTNDTAAIVAAAADLRAAGGGTLWFPPGSKCLVSYHAHAGYTGDGNRAVLLFTEVDIDVRIEGNGSEILFDADDRTTYAHFIYCYDTGTASRMKIRGLTYKYNKRPFVTGVVTAISAGSYIEVELDYHPSFGDIHRIWRYKNKLWEEAVIARFVGTWEAGQSLTLVSGSTYRVDDTGSVANLTNLAVGDEVVLEHQIDGADFFRGYGVGSVVFDDVVVMQACTAARIISAEYVDASGLHLISEPGLRVKHSINSDGIHFGAVRTVHAKGMYMEASADDLINISSRVTNVKTRNSDTQVTCGRRFPQAIPQVGVPIQLFDATRLTVFEAHIVSVDAISAGEFTVTVTGSIPAAVDSTWELSQIVEDAQISVHGGFSRGRAVYASARSLAITDCKIERTTGPGILIDSHNMVHTAIRSLTITGNDLYRCNNGTGIATSPSALQVDAFQTDGTTFLGIGAYENVTVERNAITETNNGGIRITGALRCSTRFNRLARIGLAPLYIAGFTGGTPLAWLNCDDITVEGNSLAGGSTADAQQQGSTNFIWAPNINILPSSDVNAITYTSPRAFFSDVGGDLSETSGDIVPTFAFTNNGDTAVTYRHQKGGWIRHGKLVTFWIDMAFDLVYSTASGFARVGTLPFVAVNSRRVAVTIGVLSNVNLKASSQIITAKLTTEGNTISFSQIASNSYDDQMGTIQFPNGTNNIQLVVSGSYETSEA